MRVNWFIADLDHICRRMQVHEYIHIELEPHPKLGWRVEEAECRGCGERLPDDHEIVLMAKFAANKLQRLLHPLSFTCPPAEEVQHA